MLGCKATMSEALVLRSVNFLVLDDDTFHFKQLC